MTRLRPIRETVDHNQKVICLEPNFRRARLLCASKTRRRRSLCGAGAFEEVRQRLVADGNELLQTESILMGYQDTVGSFGINVFAMSGGVQVWKSHAVTCTLQQTGRCEVHDAQIMHASVDTGSKRGCGLHGNAALPMQTEIAIH